MSNTVKRLFFEDPSTGVQTPLLIWDVDPNKISDLSINKQDKTDNALNTTAKTVVGAINELKTADEHTMHEPYVDGSVGQVLTSDGSGFYTWEDGGVKNISLQYDPSKENLDIVITK